MTFRDLNTPESHDGTRFEWNMGGPHHLTIRLNGEVVYQGRVKKGYRFLAHFEPLGEWEE